MRKFVLLLSLFSLVYIYSCDDGDVIDFEFDFEDTINSCEGVSDLVLYKTKEDPSESLSVLISTFTEEDLIAVEENDTLLLEKTGTFTYRTYNDASLPSDLFCSDISAETDINLNESDDVTVTILTILTEDDGDGIAAELEDINGNGDLKDDDTDDDGLWDYIDEDDDGDNVATADENPDPNGDGILDDAQDTDGDGIPDYLDNDDDGDGVLTRDEQSFSPEDNNPTNDITDPNVGPDYLNPAIIGSVAATSYRQHTITQDYSIYVTISDISLDFISQTELDFGTLDGTTSGLSISTFRDETPEFN